MNQERRAYDNLLKRVIDMKNKIEICKSKCKDLNIKPHILSLKKRKFKEKIEMNKKQKKE